MLGCRCWLRLRRDRAKAQRIHHRDRPRAHGEDIAQNSADAGGRSLEGLNERRMIVRLDLEGAGPAVADINDAGVFARPLQHLYRAGAKPKMQAILIPVLRLSFIIERQICHIAQLVRRRERTRDLR